MSEAPRPVVSVCIANYNGEHLLDACIGSVLAQENAPSFEIIVHDDASTDRSLEVLARYPLVRVLGFAENAGFCVSNNRMAEIAEGEFLLLLNNDAQLFPDALSTLLDRSVELRHDAVLGMPQYDARSGSLVDHGCWLDWLMSPVSRCDPRSAPPSVVIGACMWIPRSIWDRTDGFPAFFGTNAEDIYLCCAARWLGHEVAVTRGSGFLHILGASQGGGRADEAGRLTLNRRRRFSSERNRAIVAWVFLPAGLAFIQMLLNWAVLSAEALVLTMRTRDPGIVGTLYVESQRSALARIPDARRLRHRLSGLRRTDAGGPFGRLVVIPAKLRMLMRYGLPHA